LINFLGSAREIQLHARWAPEIVVQ